MFSLLKIIIHTAFHTKYLLICSFSSKDSDSLLYMYFSVIEEWSKREVMQDRSILHKHPSIVQFIAGHRGDRKPVIKVYLRNNDEKAKQFFQNCCSVSEDTQFEFVNVAENSKEISKEVEKINLHEKKAPAFKKSAIKKLGEIIQEHGEKIYARYSNVIGIGISQVKHFGSKIQEQPCIVLYCLDKTLIPFGEKPLPESLAGWPCDVREDFVIFGMCPSSCPSSSQDFPELGCSIGIPSVDSAGSVGFLVESTNPINKLRCGFLTASHVAIKQFHELYHHKSLLSMHQLALKKHFVVHPSWQDNKHVDHTVGEVVESFCGNYGLEKIGMDLALVMINNDRRESMYVFLPFLTA